MQPELLLDARLELGESPVWDSEAGILYFVDVHAGNLHSFDPVNGTHQTVNLGESIGCLAPAMDGQLVLAVRSGIQIIKPSSGKRLTICSPEKHLPGNRFNDGKCDPVGRFLVGTMDDAEKEHCGSLYSFSIGGSCKILLRGLGISNGMTWSPDGRTFYFIDTPTRLIMAYDYDLTSGKINHPRPVVCIPKDMGWPDGMTSDLDGMLWVALWGGAKITCWNPDTGKLKDMFSIPAENITSCIFGGQGRHDLYITTARKGLRMEEIQQYPLSGGLFRLRTDTIGVPTFSFQK